MVKEDKKRVAAGKKHKITNDDNSKNVDKKQDAEKKRRKVS